MINFKYNKTENIEEIDFNLLVNQESSINEIMMSKLKNCICSSGFLILKNTPISFNTISDLFVQYKKFFSKPYMEKNKVNMSLTNSNRGWGAPKSEQVNSNYNPDFKEIYDSGPNIDQKHEFSELPYYAKNIWPDDMSELKNLADNFYIQCNNIGLKILNKIAKVLNLKENFFSDKFDLPMALLRCNYYPERPAWAKKKDFGIAPHTDYGCLTLLFTEGDPGLEIRKFNQNWLKVKANKGDIIVNFGDMLQLWSNNQVKATQHRVIGTNKTRFSIPFFFNPRHDTVIKSYKNKDDLLAGDYLSYKYDTTYRHKF